MSSLGDERRLVLVAMGCISSSLPYIINMLQAAFVFVIL